MEPGQQLIMYSLFMNILHLPNHNLSVIWFGTSLLTKYIERNFGVKSEGNAIF